MQDLTPEAGIQLGATEAVAVAQDLTADTGLAEWRVMALFALAETMTPEALRDYAADKSLPNYDVHNAMSYAGFRLADAATKNELLASWFRSRNPQLTQQALRHVLDIQLGSALEQIGIVTGGPADANGEAPMAAKWRQAIRKLGFRVLGQYGNLTIAPINPTQY